MSYSNVRADGSHILRGREARARPSSSIGGFADPLEVPKASGLARALSGEFRWIFADHRDQGGSDKPHEAEAYELRRRVGDAVAVLDVLGLEHAHFLGSSWGARLGFALGEHAPSACSRSSSAATSRTRGPRVADRPGGRRGHRRLQAGRDAGFVAAFETALGYRFPEPTGSGRSEKNDPAALEAAWRSVRLEGPVSQHLGTWRVPCLICAGEADEMHDAARQAAEEIPGARFVSLAGHSYTEASTRRTISCCRTFSSFSAQR